jgi:hypothetical protein
MSWQILSRRRGEADPDSSYESVPIHLKHQLIRWLRQQFGLKSPTPNERLLRNLAVVLRQRLPLDVDLRDYANELILEAAGGDAAHQVDDEFEDFQITNHEFFLDLIDATLHLQSPDESDWEELDEALLLGGAAWRVGEDKASLVRAVADETQAIFNLATAAAPDEATAELKKAWHKAFSSNPDPSNAWSHAIKAVEEVLIRAVLPDKAKATLGQVIRELEGKNGANWAMSFPDSDADHDPASLVSILRLVWPNPDRHGGSSDGRAPSEHEARAVVTLAATIVQWHRDGWVVRKKTRPTNE